MGSGDIQALWLTVKLASLTCVILLCLGTPLAWWLTKWQGKAKPLVHAIIALPLILPPTVLGFYFLIAFSPNHFFGKLWFDISGQRLAFSFEGILMGSVVYSLPFTVQPLHNAFSQLDPRYLDVAYTLGLKGWRCFLKLIIPLSRGGFISAIGLSFAHTVGEFGVVLMIGGNIPGETKVLSIALFDHVESMQYTQAHQLAFGLLIFSLLSLSLLYWFNDKTQWK